jgi:hypothetical protein
VEEFFGTIADYISSVFRLALFGMGIIRRHLFATFVIASVIGISYGARLFYNSLLAKTTLSFAFTVDGKALPSGVVPDVQVDGNSFASASRIGLGRHELRVRLKDSEPYQIHFWILRAKNLGVLPLESSKGSLSVTVNPSPAGVILKRNGEVVRQGNAPMIIDELPVGDYTLAIHRGEYEEDHLIEIQRQLRTATNIDLNLGTMPYRNSIRHFGCKTMMDKLLLGKICLVQI